MFYNMYFFLAVFPKSTTFVNINLMTQSFYLKNNKLILTENKRRRINKFFFFAFYYSPIEKINTFSVFLSQRNM